MQVIISEQLTDQLGRRLSKCFSFLALTHSKAIITAQKLWLESVPAAEPRCLEVTAALDMARVL